MLEGRLILNETKGFGCRVMVLKEDTSRPQRACSRSLPLLPLVAALGEWATIMVRGCGVERISVRTFLDKADVIVLEARVNQSWLPLRTGLGWHISPSATSPLLDVECRRE